MKKLTLFMFLLLFVVPCFGQLVLTIPLTGVVNAPIDTNGWQSFKVILTQNITFSFVVAPPIPPPAQSTLRVIFTQDATGGRTVTFAANISNPCAVTATANAATVCQFVFDNATNTWQGISGVPAVLTAKTIEGVRYCEQFPGIDFVAQCNAAYADLPATGGDIYLPAGSYSSNSTSGILFTTTGKPARLICPPAGATTLTYTATTATAITFNFSAGNLAGAGISGCQFNGPGSGTASTAISLGGVSGASQIVIRDTKVTGFGTFESIGNNVFLVEHTHVVALGNGTGFSALSGISNSGESISFDKSTIGGISGASSLCLAITAPLSNFSFTNGSLDQCTWNLTAGQLHFANVHFENPGGAMTTDLFVNAGARVSLVNPDFQWDFSSAPTPSAAISCSGGIVIIEGASFFSNSVTLANDISDSGTCEIHEFGTKLSGGFTAFIGNTSSGALSTYGNIWGNNTTAGTLVGKFQLSTILTVSTLPTCSAGLEGTVAAVSDATAPTYNTALTGGGAVHVPVYCNGSAWTSH